MTGRIKVVFSLSFFSLLTVVDDHQSSDHLGSSVVFVVVVVVVVATTTLVVIYSMRSIAPHASIPTFFSRSLFLRPVIGTSSLVALWW